VEVRKDKLKFFRSSAEFKRWLDKNHDKATELWIGFYRKDSGKGGITYSEALDEALCYGWIDGIRKKIDDISFTNRFTPRKNNSIWSNVNIAHVARLTRDGRMMEPGVAAYNAKKVERSGVYTYERGFAELEPEMLKRFKKNSAAWKYFEQQPPYYRKLAIGWVIRAKREETREKRLADLITFSEKLMRLPQYTPARPNQKKK
jgi:uncharacterized protein YdeI (YjbR/CyaY-like superfamily)